MADVTFVEQEFGLMHVHLERVVFDVGVFQRVALDQGYGIARQEVVPCFWWLPLHAGVAQIHPVAELYVMILPGEASTRLLASSGSTYCFVDKVSKMSEVSSALGRKR